jgi:hypothetical protein
LLLLPKCVWERLWKAKKLFSKRVPQPFPAVFTSKTQKNRKKEGLVGRVTGIIFFTTASLLSSVSPSFIAHISEGTQHGTKVSFFNF